ncbi:MAG: alpha/beta fold hydrolase [Gaiellaceae bacterium]
MERGDELPHSRLEDRPHYTRSTEGLAHTDTGKGPPVVLLHGLTCHLGYWCRVISLLNGVRIVALDFRGHGLSEHRDSYGYMHYERDLLSLLDAFDLDRITVAGHSLGGYVALCGAHLPTAGVQFDPRES